MLELARAGEDLDGVVSFHGGLDTPHPADAQQIKGHVLVLHGQNDLFVGKTQLAAFHEEMRQAGIHYRVIEYPGAVHSFTVPDAGSDPASGVAYDAEADRQSWEAMRAFFAERFAE